MKKRIISLLLTVLVLLALVPCAYATQFASLASVQAGASVDRLITTLPGGYITDAVNVPAGCEIITDSAGAVRLTGAARYPGQYSFSVTAVSSTGSSDVITCTLDVLPATPQLTVSGSVNCYVGGTARLSVAASVADGGTLSYQWYLSYNGASSGGALITGATSAEYLADTSRTGVAYYYCEVTNTNSSQTATAVSPALAVNVTEAVIDSIMVNSLPSKTRYNIGDAFEAAGVSLLVHYGDGSQQVIYDGFSYTPAYFAAAGQTNVTLSYAGKTCSFPVTVVSEEESLQGIGMVILPDKSAYKHGDSFDPTGLVFRAYYSDGTYKDIDSGYTYAPKIFNSSGTQEVTITYKDKTCRFDVSVEAVQTVSTLEIASSPGKLVYSVGDTLDTSGLVLKLTGSTGTQLIHSGFTCEPTTLSTAGSQAVRVRYGDLVATFTVTVNSAVTSPSPSVTIAPSVAPSAAPSAAVTSPSPSPAASSAGRGSKNTVLVVIMLVALMCLIALGTYMLVMNAGGWEAFKNRIEYRLYKLKRRFRGDR